MSIFLIYILVNLLMFRNSMIRQLLSWILISLNRQIIYSWYFTSIQIRVVNLYLVMPFMSRYFIIQIKCIIIKFYSMKSIWLLIIWIIDSTFSKNKILMCLYWFWLQSCNLTNKLICEYFLLSNKFHYWEMCAENIFRWSLRSLLYYLSYSNIIFCNIVFRLFHEL